MKRAIAGVALALFTLCGAYGQYASAPTAFEVASVRPNMSGSHSSRFSSGKGGLNTSNVSLRDFVRWAYGVKDYQVTAPDWLATQRFDIAAKAEASVPNDQLMAMLQALLVERFKLVVHRETKERTVYSLVVGKNGPKLHEVDAGPGRTTDGRGSLSGQKMSMSQLADSLSKSMTLPVLNMTGIKGAFDIELKWAPDEDSANGPSIFTAVQEQLGLKLEPRKGPMEIIVVDHAERVPTEN
jgi:uncharacterized protein (TIGR03435 family)